MLKYSERVIWFLALGIGISSLLISASILFAKPTTDGAGASLMSVGELISRPGKFDGQHVWVGGIVRVKDGRTYLEVLSGSNKSINNGVCLDGTDPIDPSSLRGQQTLAQLHDLPLAVHGIFHQTIQKSGGSCPLGMITVVLIEISFV